MKDNEDYVLIVFNDSMPMLFEDAKIHWQGNVYKLPSFMHIAYSVDSMIVSTDLLLELSNMPNVEFDIRYILNLNNRLELYMFVSSLENIYMVNRGIKEIILDTGLQLLALKPGGIPYKIPIDRLKVN